MLCAFLLYSLRGAAIVSLLQVRVFSLGDGVAGKVGFKARTLRKAPADVAFGADPNHVAVLTQGAPRALWGRMARLKRQQ